MGNVEASSWWPQPECHGDKGCDHLSYLKKREWQFQHHVEHITWAGFVSCISLEKSKAENWLKYFSVPASGNNNPARLSYYAGLGCLFPLSKHVRTKLPLISVCFDFCPSLPLPCYSQTCPSACFAICTFPGCSGAERPGLLQGILHCQYSKYLVLFSPTLMPFVPLPVLLTFPDLVVPAQCHLPIYDLSLGILEFGCQKVYNQ